MRQPGLFAVLTALLLLATLATATTPALAQDPTPTIEAEVVAPQGTAEPAEDVSLVDDDGGLGRGTLIVGGLAIVVALAVVATLGRRRWVR